MKRALVLCTVVIMGLSIAVPAVAQPGNDDMAAATEVTVLPFADVVDTTEATTEPEEPVEEEDFCPPRGATVWYALTLETSQQVTINTAGSDYDTTLAVYTGTDFSDLDLVDCNDDTIIGLLAALTITADAGVTYLIQVGAFGGDFGGELRISIAEPGRATGKPLIFKSRFKGSFADAFTEEFDEETFSFKSASLVDGRSSVGGRPDRFVSLFVSEFVETFDEANETFTFIEWFGVADLSPGQYEIDKKLRTAWVLTDMILQGVTCTGGFDEVEFECTDLGTAEVTVDMTWDGVGAVERTRFQEKSTFDGIRTRFRGSLSFRNADVTGGWSGERSADMGEAFGVIGSQTTGDFVMIRGAGLP